jgi:hypothetical protein
LTGSVVGFHISFPAVVSFVDRESSGHRIHLFRFGKRLETAFDCQPWRQRQIRDKGESALFDKPLPETNVGKRRVMSVAITKFDEVRLGLDDAAWRGASPTFSETSTNLFVHTEEKK